VAVGGFPIAQGLLMGSIQIFLRHIPSIACRPALDRSMLQDAARVYLKMGMPHFMVIFFYGENYD
jgi:hypothetical protein